MVARRLQLTLAILKPDLCMRHLAKEAVLDTIQREGFSIVRSSLMVMSRDKAERFYVEHRGKFFYDRLVSYMCAYPVYPMILAHPNAIQQWRSLMGPTKPCVAQAMAPLTLRGMYGLTDTRNSTHGSDSEANARREIHLLFPDFDIEHWYKNEEQYYRNLTTSTEMLKDLEQAERKII